MQNDHNFRSIITCFWAAHPGDGLIDENAPESHHQGARPFWLQGNVPGIGGCRNIWFLPRMTRSKLPALARIHRTQDPGPSRRWPDFREASAEESGVPFVWAKELRAPSGKTHRSAEM